MSEVRIEKSSYLLTLSLSLRVSSLIPITKISSQGRDEKKEINKLSI